MKFGDRVRDKITGFEGIVTGKASYITGCDQVLLAPPSKEGDFKESMWFDVDRCVVVDEQVVSVESVSHASRPGPDKPAPKR